jgi:DNA repair protein RecO (recombination protein O)
LPRTFTYTALVLRTRPSGESNRDAWFLTAEEGLLQATVFGGPKSRLRSHVAPFQSGPLWIYHDPVRDSRKVTDFDVLCWRPGIREQYDRTMAADALAETILASHGGGGNWEAAFSLAGKSLDALEGADDANCLRVLVHFFWNWLDILGLRPEALPPLSAGAERWLAAAEDLDPRQLFRYTLAPASLTELKTALTLLLTEALGRRLPTWDW